MYSLLGKMLVREAHNSPARTHLRLIRGADIFGIRLAILRYYDLGSHIELVNECQFESLRGELSGANEDMKSESCVRKKIT